MQLIIEIPEDLTPELKKKFIRDLMNRVSVLSSAYQNSLFSTDSPNLYVALNMLSLNTSVAAVRLIQEIDKEVETDEDKANSTQQ